MVARTSLTAQDALRYLRRWTDRIAGRDLMGKLCLVGPLLAVAVAFAAGCVQDRALEQFELVPAGASDPLPEMRGVADRNDSYELAEIVQVPGARDGAVEFDLVDAVDTGVDVVEVSDVEVSDVEVEVVCVADCAGKECGPDGCGGSCGICAPGYSCAQGDDGGHCVVSCLEWCEGKECGVAGPHDECPCGECDEPGQQCMDVICNPGKKCEEVPNNGYPCDDGNPCTDPDECDDGECVGELLAMVELVEKECPCETDDDCQPLEDGDLCNGTLHCAKSAGEPAGICQVDEKTIVEGSCDDDNPCTDDFCDPPLGCVNESDDGNHCADELVCNGLEICTDGACLPGTPMGCDDGDACTDDSCSEVLGGCVHVTIDCDDGNLCTVDECEPDTGCVYHLLNCDDGVECTNGMCNPLTGCFFEGAGDGAECDSGNPCTLSDYCWTGVCQPAGPADSLCNDGAKCTIDVCSTEDGCVHEPIDCNDGSLCTSDWCDPGTGYCVHEDIVCDDGDICTIDFCAALSGCAFTPVDCDDGSLCTLDWCDPGFGGCVHEIVDCTDGDICTFDSCGASSGCVYTAVDCDDDNACTDDSCMPGFGCLYTLVPEGTSCGGGYKCIAGACVCQPACSGKECGADGCDGSCGECTCGKSCQSGSCQWPCASHKYSSCHDGDDYWFDSCGQLEDKKEECGGLFCSGTSCAELPNNSCTPDEGYQVCYEHSYEGVTARIQLDLAGENTIGYHKGKWAAQGAYKVKAKCTGKLYKGADSSACNENGRGGEYIGTNGPFVITHATAYSPAVSQISLACFAQNGGTWASNGANYSWDNMPVVHCFSPLQCGGGEYCDTSGDLSDWQCKPCQ